MLPARRDTLGSRAVKPHARTSHVGHDRFRLRILVTAARHAHLLLCMDHERRLPLEPLLAEAGYLRALARELARDASAAEDLVQDTLARAVERPPRALHEPRGLRAWLRNVLTNRAREVRRAANARAHHERLAARLETVEGDADERDERVRLLQRLAQAILELPEPYKHAITLRYLDGLSPSEVARVQRITPEAARQRLSRGLALLRSKLDQDCGGRGRWSALVLFDPRPGSLAPIASLIPGALTMSTLLKVGAAAAAALLVALWIGYASTREPVAPEEELAVRRASELSASTDVPAQPAVLAPLAEPQRTAESARPSVSSGVAIDRELDLFGVVLDPHGKPIAGASVRVSRNAIGDYSSLDFQGGREFAAVAETQSASDGAFRVRLDPGRPYALDVEARGFAPATLPHRYAGERVEVRMQPGATLVGRIMRRSDGSPVAGANVSGRIFATEDTLMFPRPVFSGASDSNGHFRFENLPAHELYVIVEPRENLRTAMPALTLVAGKERTLEVVLEDAQVLRGRVVDAQQKLPISGAEVGMSWTFERPVRTNAAGEFELLGCAPGAMLAVGARADGFAARVVNLRNGALPERLEIVLDAGRRLSGRLLDQRGAPIADAYVAAMASMFANDAQEIDWCRTHSDADGKFLIVGLRSDLRHGLIVRREGLGAVLYDLPDDELARSAIDLGDLVLAPMASVRGVVVDKQGKPMVDQKVTLHGANADRHRFGTLPEGLESYAEEKSARTDDLGRFSFADLAAGHYKVESNVKTSNRSVEVELDVTAGARVEDVRLVLDPGLAISGSVRDVAGERIPGVVYVSVDPEQAGDVDGADVRCDTDGRFRVLGLAPGTYRITARAYNLGPRTQRLAEAHESSVAAGREDVELRLVRAVTVGGRVLDAQGASRQGVFVTARSENARFGTPTFETDADGRFHLLLAEGFPWTLEVRTPASYKAARQLHGDVAPPSDREPDRLLATLEDWEPSASELILRTR
jgi:RNA polymerase sigma factor (sigma-70 family)